MADTRTCEQCGTEFAPRREHARFCSARCRVAWNRAHISDDPAEVNALVWSIGAMQDTTDRLCKARAADQQRAFAVIGEAVWWVTIVDATLVRHVPDAYDGALASHSSAERQLIEDTLAGLRFVRNRMGHEFDYVDFIRPEGSRTAANGARITSWLWESVPAPELASFSARGQEWELTRYRAYQAQLAGHTVGETFGRATAFLNLAAGNATLVVGAPGQGAAPVSG